MTKLDRLARSTRDLLNTLPTISERGASFRSLGDVWCDTTTPHGELMVTILSGLATFELHLIRSRTTEGRRAALARGVKMGRKPLLSAHQIAEIRERKVNGEGVRFLARSYGVSPNTISRVK